jgi:general transcription factor 3C polypeptide 3 (transcription factor C subunit 4)
LCTHRYQQAIDLLLEVIRQVPNLADPYNTLGVLHEVLGQPRKALDFYMIAAHMTGKVQCMPWLFQFVRAVLVSNALAAVLS